jgi:hypothetical protein
MTGAERNVCIAPDLCNVVLANFNLAQLIIAQIAEVVVFFHQESEGIPGACIELVGRFFRSDAPDMPAFPDGSDSLWGWRMWHARWRDAGDPRQYIAHAALAFPATRLPRSAFFTTLEWMFDPRSRRASHALLRNEMIVLMWQICTGEQAGLPYCDIV